jgi:hypothetical protein
MILQPVEDAMPATSYQTVRLQPGSHRSPEDGVCVMELSSMLAGEPFSDRPACVCPVIAGLLRSYNDLVDDERRQRLYGCAALVVGSRADEEVERRRADRLREAIADVGQRRPTVQRLLFGPPRPMSFPATTPADTAAYAARALLADGERGQERLLALVAELSGMGAETARARREAVRS